MKRISDLTNKDFSNFNSSYFWTRPEPKKNEFEAMLHEYYGEFKMTQTTDKVAEKIYDLNVNFRQYPSWKEAYNTFLMRHPILKAAVEQIVLSRSYSTACSF